MMQIFVILNAIDSRFTKVGELQNYNIIKFGGNWLIDVK